MNEVVSCPYCSSPYSSINPCTKQHRLASSNGGSEIEYCCYTCNQGLNDETQRINSALRKGGSAPDCLEINRMRYRVSAGSMMCTEGSNQINFIKWTDSTTQVQA